MLENGFIHLCDRHVYFDAIFTWPNCERAHYSQGFEAHPGPQALWRHWCHCTLEENVSIVTIHCDLVIATHCEKTYNLIILVVKWRVLAVVFGQWATKTLWLPAIMIYYAFSCHESQWPSCNGQFPSGDIIPSTS